MYTSYFLTAYEKYLQQNLEFELETINCEFCGWNFLRFIIPLYCFIAPSILVVLDIRTFPFIVDAKLHIMLLFMTHLKLIFNFWCMMKFWAPKEFEELQNGIYLGCASKYAPIDNIVTLCHWFHDSVSHDVQLSCFMNTSVTLMMGFQSWTHLVWVILLFSTANSALWIFPSAAQIQYFIRFSCCWKGKNGSRCNISELHADFQCCFNRINVRKRVDQIWRSTL